MLDVNTLQETPSPLGSVPFELSPDGHWLVTTDYLAGVHDVHGLEDGCAGRLQRDALAQWVPPQWRPGHVELWLPNGPDGPPATWIKQPGVAPIEVPGVAAHDRSYTADGIYWFSAADDSNNPAIMVGSADDPTGPRFEVTPAVGA